MNRIEKFLIVVGLAVLVIGALIIRHQDAGYLAFQKGDYRTAHTEFSKLAEQGDPWGTHYTGLMHGIFLLGSINQTKAAKYYLAGARLGNVRSAILYIDLLRRSKRLNQYCTLYADFVDKAVQTHNPYALVLKAQQLISGRCVQKDIITGVHFFKWAGEVKPQIGDHYSNSFESLSDSQKQQFEALKIERPPAISEQSFLEFLLAKQEQFGLIKFD
ncbi:MAG: sel1 repeat family protein [Rhodospirillaceae bacterium]|nr:sel1 repeat family protein [Rhodospirillaceae bacterium]